MSPIPFVTQLGDELDAAITADQVARHRTPRRRWRLPMLAIFAPLAVTAVAVAAGTILFGSAYRPPWAHRTPQADLGVPVAGSVRLLSLRVPDPAGGPPWGMRTLRTTRGYECVQVGRVLDGQLGVLGQDGWFGDDHRFHPIPDSVFADFNCGIVGSSGYALVGSWSTIHASGIDVVGTCAYPEPRWVRPHLPTCPAGDLRFLAYGLVGPNAQAITYAPGASRRVIRLTGAEGAYLVVRREPSVVAVHGSTAGGLTLAGGGGPGSFPGAVKIVYRDGHTCPAQDPAGTDTCAYRGFHLAGIPGLHVHRVRVRVGQAPAGRLYGPGYSNLVLHFRAPVAVTSGKLDYVVTVLNKGVPTAGATLDRNVRKGAQVALAVAAPNCTRHARVTLFLARANPSANPDPGVKISRRPGLVLATVQIVLPTATRPVWCR